MQFTTSDIQLAKAFSEKLSAACDEMLEGVPISQALLEHGVSQSTFTTLIKGLRRSENIKLPSPDDIEKLRHPAWQDDLIYDLCGDRYAYVPRDFDETLARIEDEKLNQTEKEIIDSFYRRHQSMAEISQKLGIDDSNVRVKKNQALMKLRDRGSDLVLGEEYLSRLAEMRQQYHQHEDELTWMNSAISFMKQIDTDFDRDVASDDELTDSEVRFLTEHGVRKLRDLMTVDTSELLIDIVESMEGYAALFDNADMAVQMRVYPDTPLSELGFGRRILDAFHREGLHTAGDVFALSEREVQSIDGVGDRQIIHLCWQALHGAERKGQTDEAE